MESPDHNKVVFLHKNVDDFVNELRTDCEHWYIYVSSQDVSQQGLAQYLAGLRFARIAYHNRVAREFSNGFSIQAEKRVETFVEVAIRQAKQHWPDL